MRALVCGGRDYQDRSAAFRRMDELHGEYGFSLVVHGACRKKGRKGLELDGADRWAQEWALEREIAYLGVPAKWTQDGRRAGPIRNRIMEKRCRPEIGIAFPGGPGTADMCAVLMDAGIPVIDGATGRRITERPAA